MARDVAGLVAGMALLEPGFTVSADPPRTVGRVMVEADPAISGAVDAALASAGWDVTPVAVRGLDAATTAATIVIDAEAWASDGALARSSPGRIGHDVLRRLHEASEITPAALGGARLQASQWRATLSELWDRLDLLALPTLLGFPPALDDAGGLLRIRGLTSPVNLAGAPALALPVPTGGPLPASVQLIGPAGSEERLLAAGAALEQAMGSWPAGRRHGAQKARPPARAPRAGQ
jgi:amidase